jgi:hypothetical protein
MVGAESYGASAFQSNKGLIGVGDSANEAVLKKKIKTMCFDMLCEILKEAEVSES